MRIEPAALAKRYATAFFNVWGTDFSSNEARGLEELTKFFEENRTFYITLRVPSIPADEKLNVFSQLIEKYHLPPALLRLVELLLKDGRIEMLDKVIAALQICYKKKHNIEHFTVVTSHPIDNEAKDKILAFISSRTSATVECEFITDETLISGIRIESRNYLWERSIRKTLTRLHASMLERGYDYDRKRN